MAISSVEVEPDGNSELIELTALLRIGLKTVRKIALCRPSDFDKLMDIARRSEEMAAELDEITSRHAQRRLQ